MTRTSTMAPEIHIHTLVFGWGHTARVVHGGRAHFYQIIYLMHQGIITLGLKRRGYVPSAGGTSSCTGTHWGGTWGGTCCKARSETASWTGSWTPCCHVDAHVHVSSSQHVHFCQDDLPVCACAIRHCTGRCGPRNGSLFGAQQSMNADALGFQHATIKECTACLFFFCCLFSMFHHLWHGWMFHWTGPESRKGINETDTFHTTGETCFCHSNTVLTPQSCHTKPPTFGRRISKWQRRFPSQ